MAKAAPSKPAKKAATTKAAAPKKGAKSGTLSDKQLDKVAGGLARKRTRK